MAAWEVPVEDRHFEDFVPGAVAECGPIGIDEAEVIAFARQFDPQPIHTDKKVAGEGPFGGLIASGWHTVSLVMRVLVDHYLAHGAALASPGVDELRWLQPVRPGDVLRVRAIHGKGLTSPNREPVLKGRVRRWLAHWDEVLAYCEAPPHAGGGGAVLILLRGK